MRSIKIPALKVSQPIGDFYIAAIDSRDLTDISYADIRRIESGEEREHLQYIGIQRPLSPKRVSELERYVQARDASFPTAVILAVPGECAQWDEESRTLTLTEYLGNGATGDVPFDEIAKILDGQHRVAGLKKYNESLLSQGLSNFELNVAIFVDIDVAEQAAIFSTVNLAQTKVNKSLVYDLFDYAKSPSPHKTGHNIAVALDSAPLSPFYKRIKRLGVATEGRFKETLTQATFVDALIPLLSPDPVGDRTLFLRGDQPPRASERTLRTVFFRNLFLEGKEEDIAKIIWIYFDAVRHRWPAAWEGRERGIILSKTNGFRALMRFFSFLYGRIAKPGEILPRSAYDDVLARIVLQDDEFNTTRYQPGSTGESQLYKDLVAQSQVL